MAFNKGGARGGFSGGNRGGFSHGRGRGGFGGRTGGRDNRGGGRREPVSMHKVICDECGNSCEVPFKPSSDKPIFCDNCFVFLKSDTHRTNFGCIFCNNN